LEVIPVQRSVGVEMVTGMTILKCGGEVVFHAGSLWKITAF
jgi:hypothetical protein